MLVYLIIFLPTFLTTVLCINHLSNRYMLEVNVDNNTLVVKNTLGQIDDVLRDMERISLVTIADNNIQEMLSQPEENYNFTYYKNQKWLEQFFVNLISIREQVDTIRIVQPDNTLFYRYDSLGRTFQSKTDYMKSSWVQKCRQTNGKTVFLTTAGRDDILNSGSKSDPEWLAFSVARKINRTLSNQGLGFIKVDTNLSLMDGIVRQYQNDGSEIVICDQEKKIVYDKDFTLAGKSFFQAFPENTLDFHRSGSYQIKINGTETLATFLTSGYSGWTIICLTPETIVFSGVQAVNRVDIAIVLLGATLAVVLSAFISKAVTKNIVRLNNSMKKVQTGDLNVSLAPHSRDEIGELTVTFDTMIEKIKVLIQQDYIERIRNQELEIKHRKAQYQALLNQINPHFLYNTLDVIRITAALNGDGEVEQMLLSLSCFYRLNLARTGNDVTTTLHQELELVRAYLAICQFRMRNIKTSITDGTNPKQEYQVPRFILQPIVENAVNHGREHGESCSVTVRVETVGELLVISISDDGVGMSEQQIRAYNDHFSKGKPMENETGKFSSGIGMTNVNQRIRLMYGSEYGLRLAANRSEGLTVQCRLPVIVL